MLKLFIFIDQSNQFKVAPSFYYNDDMFNFDTLAGIGLGKRSGGEADRRISSIQDLAEFSGGYQDYRRPSGLTKKSGNRYFILHV
jgi:hypothetical protein